MFDLSTLKKLFSFAILSKLLPTVGSLAFGLYIAYMGWISLGPEKPEPDKYRKELATAAVNKAVEEIRNSRGDVRTAVMVHFANDPSDFVSDTMRKRLNSSGVLSLEDISFSERLEKILNLRTAGAENEKEALAAAKHHKVQGVLWGKIDTFESSDRGAILTGEWTLTDKEGNTVCSGKFDENSNPKAKPAVQEENTVANAGGNTAAGTEKETVDLTPIKEELAEVAEPVRATASQVPWYIRFLGFVLLVLLLPVVTISFLRCMVAKKSNGINAFVLGLYTVIGAICAFFMIGGEFNSIWDTLLFLGATAISFFYNVAMMSFALKLES